MFCFKQRFIQDKIKIQWMVMGSSTSSAWAHQKGQGRCTSGDLSVSWLSLFTCIYLDCDRCIFPYVGLVVQSDENGRWRVSQNVLCACFGVVAGIFGWICVWSKWRTFVCLHPWVLAEPTWFGQQRVGSSEHWFSFWNVTQLSQHTQW